MSEENEENKDLVRRFYEAYSTVNVAALDYIVSTNFVSHQNSAPEAETGLDSLKRRMTDGYNTQEPVFTIEEMIAEGDKVVARYVMRGTMTRVLRGNSGTVGKQYAVRGCAVFTVAGGKLVERWVNWDKWDQEQQVGAISSPTGRPRFDAPAPAQ